MSQALSAEDRLRCEIADVGIDMCFDTDIDYRLGLILLELFELNFPDHLALGLAYWAEKYRSLEQCTSLAQMSRILDDWLFSEEGKRAGDSFSDIAIMSAMLFINASRNIIWNMSINGLVLNQQTENKFQALRVVLDELCAAKGLTILTLLA